MVRKEWFAFKLCPGLAARQLGAMDFMQCIPDWLLSAKNLVELISKHDVDLEEEWTKCGTGGGSNLDNKAPQQAVSKGVQKYAKLHLLPSAPHEVVKAAYKALALIYHPDREGGSAEDFRDLKDAYEKITGDYKR